MKTINLLLTATCTFTAHSMEFVRPFEGKVEKALEYINDGGPVDSNLLFQSLYVQDFEVCTVLMGDG